MEIVHGSKAEVCRALRRSGVECQTEGYNHMTRTHWKIVSDASVEGGFEVVSPVLKGQAGWTSLKRHAMPL